MKTSTLHSLITARTLHDQSKELVASGDRHLCSAGLILLQDAFEIILLALLIEKGVDEIKPLEKFTFDEMMGELKSIGVPIPKMGTLKIMNRARIQTKHYGQLAEPVTVQGYAEAVALAIASIVPEVIGLRFEEIFLSMLLKEGETQTLLMEGEIALKASKYTEALISIRKALYVEIEKDYAINGWVDFEYSTTKPNGLAIWIRGGINAPYYKRSSQWIKENVNDPFDYIQMDPENLRRDALDWGVSSIDIENLRRLTPAVFRSSKEAPWQIRLACDRDSTTSTRANVQYCLDKAISILLKKQIHTSSRRWIHSSPKWMPLPQFEGHSVYKKARTDSDIVHTMHAGFVYALINEGDAFDPDLTYYEIQGQDANENALFIPVTTIRGYLLFNQGSE